MVNTCCYLAQDISLKSHLYSYVLSAGILLSANPCNPDKFDDVIYIMDQAQLQYLAALISLQDQMQCFDCQAIH